MSSMAEEVKRKCLTLGRDGFCLSRGVLWQHKRVNARPFPFFVGKLLAEQRCAKSGFQTYALYRYTDGSMLVVHRTVYRSTLAATKGV